MNRNPLDRYLSLFYSRGPSRPDVARAFGMLATLGACCALWFVFLRCLFSL